MPRKRTSSPRTPRPPNAFILYRSEMIAQLPPPPPGTLRKQSEASRMISELWDNESDEVRAQYKQLSLRKKAEHEGRDPDYKYSPRGKEQREREGERNLRSKDRVTKRSAIERAGHVDSQDAFSKTGSVSESMYPSSSTGQSTVRNHFAIAATDRLSIPRRAQADETPTAWSQQDIEEVFGVLYENLGSGSNYHVQSGAYHDATTTSCNGPDGVQKVASEALRDQSYDANAHASLHWPRDREYVPQSCEASFESMVREFTGEELDQWY
ncbi:hypothetical protein C0995_004907 [Termitomyces sp. Mi166|nr:hypothetical protein C0995_004907 [Termitomyces sp. Mi166\